MLLDYSFYPLNVFIYFLIPFYILWILAITIFWKTDNIDKILAITTLLIFLVASNIFVLFILKKSILMEDSLFIYTTLFYRKKFKYKDLKIYYNRGNTYIYKNKKKIIKLNSYIKNFQLLIDKIIEINGYECIKK